MSAPTSTPSERADAEDSGGPEAELPRSFLESKVWFAAFAVVGVIVATTAVILLLRADTDDRGLTYNVIDPPQDALGFSLMDHKGEQFALADHAGETTILTMVYTSCTDVCPFVGAKLRQVVDVLGDDADGVNVVAITMDPERDTPERAAEYSRSLRMYDRWHFLVGDEETLSPLWTRYYAGFPVIGDTAIFATQEQIDEYGLAFGLTDLNERTANETRFEFGGGYDVGHATPIVVIDGDLKVRLVAGQTFDPAELAADVRIIKSDG